MSSGLSNLGRPLLPVLEDIMHDDIEAAAVAMRTSLRTHPSDATCACPTLEALALLYERGYRVVKS